jgi:hypothetical protein
MESLLTLEQWRQIRKKRKELTESPKPATTTTIAVGYYVLAHSLRNPDESISGQLKTLCYALRKIMYLDMLELNIDSSQPKLLLV